MSRVRAFRLSSLFLSVLVPDIQVFPLNIVEVIESNLFSQLVEHLLYFAK